MYRNTYVKIDEGTLKANFKEIKRKYNNYDYYFAVVKGNCYGHGVYSVKALKEAGANYFAVSSLEEAIEVRKYEKKLPILCLEPISSKYIDDILKYNVTVTIDSVIDAENYSVLKLNDKLKVHIKLDTGMNRLGIKSKKELREVISTLEKNSLIEIEGIYTHLATTGVYDYYYDKQIEKFNELINEIDLSKVKIVHVGRSLTLVNHDKLDFVNGIRLGIILYGFNGSRKVRQGLRGIISEFKRNRFIKKYNISKSYRENDLKLETAFKLYSEVISIRKVSKGEFVGYGASYIFDEDSYVATIPIGYVDGMDSSFKYVAINGKKYPIVGEICMDMTMIKVDKKVKLKDKVEIFGDTIKVREAINNRKINAYHLFTSITNRVPRVYDDLEEIKY